MVSQLVEVPGGAGIVDPSTGLPRQVLNEDSFFFSEAKYKDGQIRFLFTTFGPTVRPIIRGIDFRGGGRWAVDAACRTDGEYGILGVPE